MPTRSAERGALQAIFPSQRKPVVLVSWSAFGRVWAVSLAWIRARSFLLNTLIDSDRDLLSTRPQLVAQKYELMASGLQPFLRGTAVVYYRDISRYQDDRATLPHGEGAEQTQLYGDVHLREYRGHVR